MHNILVQDIIGSCSTTICQISSPFHITFYLHLAYGVVVTMFSREHVSNPDWVAMKFHNAYH